MILEMTTYGFEVTVYDLLAVQQFEALEQGEGEPADEGDTKPLEVVLLDQLVQVHPETREPPNITLYLHLYFHCFNILYRTNEVHSSMNTVSLITAQRYGKH